MDCFVFIDFLFATSLATTFEDAVMGGNVGSVVVVVVIIATALTPSKSPIDLWRWRFLLQLVVEIIVVAVAVVVVVAVVIVATVDDDGVGFFVDFVDEITVEADGSPSFRSFNHRFNLFTKGIIIKKEFALIPNVVLQTVSILCVGKYSM